MMDVARRQRTLFDKVWDAHVVTRREDGAELLFIDRHLVHEGSFHAFNKLKERRAQVRRPDLTIGVADHYVPTRTRVLSEIAPEIAGMIRQLDDNCRANDIRLFGFDDPRQGIVHVIGPEQGLTLPGLTMVCGDSHTSTHGAFGALAFGIGASEVAHVLLTQCLWQKRPKQMRITIDGALASGITAKDVALAIIARIGADGARGHAIEYAGTAIDALSMEGRLTLCNLAIESGARCGMIAPDETTFAYVTGRPFAPKGDLLDRAIANWRELATDAEAAFDREIRLNGQEIAPTVTWGISPEDALPISAAVPDPATFDDPAQASHVREALDYMGLQAGQALDSIKIDRVFIGSCTNSRIEDLRAAAAILAGRTARVPGLVSPGSHLVKQQAEQEGLDQIFRGAGLDWVGSGCSMCVGMNGDLVPAGERCASTTNRNFKGRQGQGARTHLMSPAMVAAAAVTGQLTDVRNFLRGDR
ncbi:MULTISPECIES: 3-isopropylmalate dehydratase large subunit [Bradyrhizobium]|jgi:3-isopropylmalate/(R)-2-methylmalate dehydratase large subunit|uniref:3-isopropylmalate dehydratase large subunit n=5 Tax=Bradyrhizobium TaxID=374 RepID=A0ABS5G7Q0_9BRAD|nr:MULTISPECIES: 3-isopropylmalate dehydratase large subunit [Bradyrhizobium]MBR1137355.1 3-isopropylmalate dehydratase large subunit [Bradyrhizobium denitrificans]MDU1491516.1 3-isopropylmalate dehydratase large subunit [Bradyrhizobium sp.]MDU1541694.1 3-isopropylmalate dehydratase large subunit [Bradyrhizobium sp.]MDU1666406.1 3-isopropylmalate dehydratase large subunit [Bradyrhizobium sp.]MDU1689304.1 3-isopropylmalate dehydratase large subunit [Bradyrhizobium sp.]